MERQQVPGTTEVLVIGGGPGGYTAAIRAAQLGYDVVVVEKDAYGGVCTHHGCIPSKAYLSATAVATRAGTADELGISAAPRIDFEQMHAWKDAVVDRSANGVTALLGSNGATVLDGVAEFTDDHTARITLDDGTTSRLAFDFAVVATGSRPVELPGFEFSSDAILSSRDALALETVPDRLVVVGAGYIGMELSTVFARLGVDVTVVEVESRVLPAYPAAMTRPVVQRARELGVSFELETAAREWIRDDDELVVTLESATGRRLDVTTDGVFVAVGREPVTDTVNLAGVGLAPGDGGFIETDRDGKTAQSHVFAVGDVAGEPMLAHEAMQAGVAAAETIDGRPAPVDRHVPEIVFTDPEVGRVGLSATEASERGFDPLVGEVALSRNDRAVLSRGTDGLVRLVGDGERGTLLGAAATGPDISPLLAELGLAIELGAKFEDVDQTIHVRPSLSAAVAKAAADGLRGAVRPSAGNPRL